jgi:hypothetical protein
VDVSDETAKFEIRSWERQRDYRVNFDSMYEEIARYCLPRAQEFTSRQSPGTRKEQYVFDSTAQLAVPACAAAIESLLVPRTQKWHGLRPLSAALQDDDEVLRYLEEKRDMMFRVRYSRAANFTGQVGEALVSLVAFGTMGLFIEDGLSKGILYQHVPLNQLYIEEDAWGRVDTVRRKYPMTVRQAIQKFGEKNLPEIITKHAQTDPFREFNFLHVVRPNEEVASNDRSFRGMKYAAFDVCIEAKCTLRRGGYRTMPYAVSRYTVSGSEVYGRSVAWDAFADIKTVNAMSKTGLRYGELVTDPPWATADIDALSPFSMRPGSINPGYINERGQVLAQSLAPQGDPRVGLEMMEQRRESINRSFLITLFQILVETPRMTATEALLRAQEKGALLAPTIGRQQSEFLDPLITRELDILEMSGMFDDMPEALAAEGGILEVVYDSPLTRAQQAEEGVGIMRTLEAAGLMAQYDEGESIRTIDAPWTLRKLAQINGAPVRMMRAQEEIDAEKAQAAQEAQLQRLLAASEQGANTAQTLATANEKMAAAPF